MYSMNNRGKRSRKHDAGKSRGGYSPKKKVTLDDLMEGFQVVGPESEGAEVIETPEDLAEQYELAKARIERVLEGGESVPDEIYAGTNSKGVYCDVHVDNPEVRLVRLHLAEVYEALLAVDSAEALKIFKENYVDGLYGAGSKLPYVETMITILQKQYAAA